MYVYMGMFVYMSAYYTFFIFTGIVNIISKLGLLFLFILSFDARCTVFNSLFHVLMYVIYQEI